MERVTVLTALVRKEVSVMRDHERGMLTYLRLAALAHEKGQSPGCGRFLILAGAEACRAGWPEIADRCRGLVLAANPAHLVGRFETFADALRSPEFTPLVARLERSCPFEKAELLLTEMDLAIDSPAPGESSQTRESALALLERAGKVPE